MLEGLDAEVGLDRLIELGRAEGALSPSVGKTWMQERFDLYSRTVIAVDGVAPVSWTLYPPLG